MKNKTLRDLPKILARTIKQNQRAAVIGKLAETNQNSFAKVLFYENLIVFRIGTIFEKINALHSLSLLKNTGKFYNFDLPNFEDLMEKYTLGSIIQMCNPILSSKPKLLKGLRKFNDDRINLTHKMFDIDKIPNNIDLLKIAKKLALSGKVICDDLNKMINDLDKLNRDILKKNKKLNRQTSPGS